MNILILCLGSYKIQDRTKSDPDNTDRQTLYAVALNRLLQILPAGSQVVVAENTVSGPEELTSEFLKRELGRSAVTKKVWVKNNALGSKNKGAGEYIMCRAALSEAKDEFEKADWVVYFTSRYPLFENLIFRYIEKYSHKDAIVANATYLYPNGTEIPSAPGNFNDVIFAMKKDWFLKYIDSMSPEELVRKKMNSEQNLYNFILANKMEFQEVYRWGLSRYNYAVYDTEVI